MRPSAPVARALELKGAEGAIMIRRTLAQDDRPVVLDEIWLPALMFKGLTAERLTGYIGPMYGLFETEFGVRMIRAEEKIRAIAADAPTAEVLAVAEGTPLLSVERLSFTYGDRPVELRRGLYRTDSHYYRNALN
jgi:GntR family transcriptional regulator